MKLKKILILLFFFVLWPIIWYYKIPIANVIEAPMASTLIGNAMLLLFGAVCIYSIIFVVSLIVNSIKKKKWLSLVLTLAVTVVVIVFTWFHSIYFPSSDFYAKKYYDRYIDQREEYVTALEIQHKHIDYVQLNSIPLFSSDKVLSKDQHVGISKNGDRLTARFGVYKGYGDFGRAYVYKVLLYVSDGSEPLEADYAYNFFDTKEISGTYEKLSVNWYLVTYKEAYE